MAIAVPRYQVPDEIYYPESDGKPMAESDLHRKIGAYCIEVLDYYYRSNADVYVAGNNMLYYVQGQPRRFVSPDVYVVLDIEKRDRLLYKTWEEAGRFPNIVIEITSKSTQTEDINGKFELYRDTFQVPEYFLYDPTNDYLRPSLIGYRLVDNDYVQVMPEADGRLHSEQLGLDLKEESGRLRLFAPNGSSPLETYAEARDRADAESRARIAATERAETESRRADAEAERANSEAKARVEAEAENARLRAELEALRRQSAVGKEAQA